MELKIKKKFFEDRLNRLAAIKKSIVANNVTKNKSCRCGYKKVIQDVTFFFGRSVKYFILKIISEGTIV